MIEELRQRRLELGLSQGQVAAMMGTTQSALSRAERGGNPTQDFLQRYDDALQAFADGDNGIANNSSIAEIATIKLIIGSIARQYGLSEVYVYGSVARGEANDDSDVDLLYRTEPGTHLNMMRREALQHELEHEFGREVSLTSLDSLQRKARTSRASQRFYQHIQPDMLRVA